MRAVAWVFGAFLLSGVTALHGQQPANGAPIGTMAVEDAKVTGAVEIHANTMTVASGSAIAAGEHAVSLSLHRGGAVHICPNSSVHLSKSAASSEMMMALDRGAVEARYAEGEYADVVMTPDLRLLLSGPGAVDLKVHINSKGDTCVDNHGSAAPYVTVTEQFGTGVYRIQANQRVMFEHGSLKEVVDNEKESCGCAELPVVSVADAGPSTSNPAKPGSAVAAKPDSQFPLAVAQGLASPNSQPQTPSSQPGEIETQVTVPIAYNGEAAPPAAGTAGSPSSSGNAPSSTAAAASSSASPQTAPIPPAKEARPATQVPTPQTPAPQTQVPQTQTAQAPPPPNHPAPNVLRAIGRFFSYVFGRR